MPAHPQHNGLCYHHGTLSPRASREDNFLRELQPFIQGNPSEADVPRAEAALSRAIRSRHISRERARTLAYLGRVMLDTKKLATEEGFESQSGTCWGDLCEVINDLDDRIIDITPVSSTKNR